MDAGGARAKNGNQCHASEPNRAAPRTRQHEHFVALCCSSWSFSTNSDRDEHCQKACKTNEATAVLPERSSSLLPIKVNIAAVDSHNASIFHPIDREDKSLDHSVQRIMSRTGSFPLSVAVSLLRQSAPAARVVFDPFCGKGTPSLRRAYWVRKLMVQTLRPNR